jgi:integrase
MKIGRHPVLTPNLARTQAIRILCDVALGNDPSGERQAERKSMTVAQLCDAYVEDMTSDKINAKKLTTIKSDISRIKNNITPQLGHHKVATITSEQIERFMNEQSRGSARRIIALTGAIFSFAVKRKLRSDNPVSAIEKPADIKKTRRLSNDEYAALHAALGKVNSTAADVILFLALTGWRSQEANNLRWSEIDIERRIVTLGATKTGQSLRPLSMAAIEILQRRNNAGEYVFTTDRGKPLYKINQAFAKLGMPDDVTPHTLRHSFASLAGDMGLSDSTIAGLLGHARSSITSRYIHLDRALIVAANDVAAETMRLMGAGAAAN